MWKQTRVLLARSHKRVYRNYVLMVGLVGQGIILGVMVGVAYYQLPEVSHSNYDQLETDARPLLLSKV